MRSYLEIQQVRYRDILCYEICVQPELRGCVLPKLTLQPLVENALYHGIKLRRGLGHIAVDAAQEDGNVRICVRDDGAGMPPERLQQLRQMRQKPKRITAITPVHSTKTEHNTLPDSTAVCNMNTFCGTAVQIDRQCLLE